MFYETETKVQKKSPLLDAIKTLKEKGILVNLVSDGAYQCEVLQHYGEQDHLTVQNGIRLFSGTYQEAVAFVIEMAAR